MLSTPVCQKETLCLRDIERFGHMCYIRMMQLNERVSRAMALHGLQTLKSIADNVGVSERTVRRHLGDRIKQGTVRILAVQNPVLYGLGAWSRIGVKVEPGYLDYVTNNLVRHPAIGLVTYCLGRYDIIIEVHFDSIGKLSYFVNSELANTQGVSSFETWIMASPRKYFGFEWPNPTLLPEHESLAGTDRCHLDELDLKIIAILTKDGLARPADICSELGVGVGVIRRRIRQMLANQVFLRRATVPREMLGGEVLAMVGVTTRRQETHGVVDTILKYPEVDFASVTLGRFNAVIGGHFSDMGRLDLFVRKGLASIDGIISTETFILTKPAKYNYIPLGSY